MAYSVLSFLFLSTLVARSLASCAHGTFLQPRDDKASVSVSTFGYSGSKGPLNWMALDPEANYLCALGQHQSPIDLGTGRYHAVPAYAVQLAVPDMLEGATLENTGTTVQVIPPQGGGRMAEMVFDNKTFEMMQFHFHLPSEHLDDGMSMAMEMHMVWQSAQKNLAVISMFIDIDHESDGAQAPLVERVDGSGRRAQATEGRSRKEGTASTSSPVETVFSPIDLIATPGSRAQSAPLNMSDVVELLNSGYYRSYSGSLTTPPCTEGVRWLVSSQKLLVQPRAFFQAREVLGFNARFLQNEPAEASPAT